MHSQTLCFLLSFWCHGHFAEAYKSSGHYNSIEPRQEIKSSSDRAEKYGSKLQQDCQSGRALDSLSSGPCSVECDCVCSQQAQAPFILAAWFMLLLPRGELCNCGAMSAFQLPNIYIWQDLRRLDLVRPPLHKGFWLGPLFCSKASSPATIL